MKIRNKQARRLKPLGGATGALLLSSAMAQGTVIGEGETRYFPTTPLDNGTITMQGGTLISEFTQALTPAQNLIFEADKTSTIASTLAQTLTIGSALNIQGVARFGMDTQKGEIELAAGIPVTVGPQAELRVEGGKLRNAAGSTALSAITSQAATTFVGEYATLDFNSSPGYIRNLQSSTVSPSVASAAQPLTIETGNYGGFFQGVSRLEKVSDGTLKLFGVTGYSGPIQISAGTLHISNEGTYGSYGSQGSGNIVNNGLLVFENFSGGVNGDISGPGNLDVTGNTLLSLAGNNTYTGRTTIGEGAELIIASSSGQYSMNPGQWINNGKLSYQRDTVTVLEQPISGTGELKQSGTGLLILAADNTYAGITTVIGKLQIGNGGASGSIGRGSLLGSSLSIVTLNRSDDFVIDNDISLQEGTLIKTGAGKSTLLGLVGGYKMGLDVQNGTVQFGTGGTEGKFFGGEISLAQGAQVAFNHSDYTELSGKLTGQGQFNLLGPARLGINLDGSAFTGHTTVTGGELFMNRNSSLGGTLSVKNGGRLQGYGQVGNTEIEAGGMLVSSGFSTLRVNGDLALQQGSTFRYYLGNPGPESTPGTSGTTRVTGNLSLNGKLQIRDNNIPALGYHRLFTYGGALDGAGLTLDTIPANYTRGQFSVDTSRSGVVDLRVAPVSAPESLLSWTGGSGTWDAGNLQWNVDGVPSWAAAWGNQHAVFKDTAGTVAVAGTQSFKGLQFLTDGWQFTTHASGGVLQTADDGSELRVLTGASATLGVAIQGAGGLSKTGGGTLVLNQANRYSGGTRLMDGVLSVAQDVNLGDRIGPLAFNGGTLRITGTDYTQTSRNIIWEAQGGAFDIAASDNRFTVAQSLTGGGDLVKLGTGTLVLGGKNSYANTHVDAGTLVGNADSIRGNLQNRGAVVFDQAQDGTFAGSVSGNGTLTKSGAGMLMLTGDGSAFTGHTQVDAGVLSVGVKGQGSLGGTLSVSNNAVLQGTGTVGNTTVQAGGAIAPGNSIGTLRVQGDLTLAPGSVYRVEADPESNNSDRIDVTGTANLAGSVLHVGPESRLAGERTYTILTANRLNGQFASSSSSFAFVDSSIGYEPQAVTLRLTRKGGGMRFADAAYTSNQRATANALESLAGGNPLYQYVLTLPQGAPAGVFDQLSGETHASITSSLSSASGVARSLPFKSLRTNLDAGLAAGEPVAQDGAGGLPVSALPSSKAQPAWAEIVGNWQTFNGNDSTSRVDQRTGGVFIGADHAVGAGWRLGGALGYTDSRITVDAKSSKADVDSYSATIYGGKSFKAGPGNINWLAGAGYIWHDVSTTRNVAAAGQPEKLTANYGASTAQVFTEIGYALPVTDRLQLEPFSGVAWSNTRTRGFQETGGIAALQGQSASNTLTTTTLGLRGKTAFSAGKTEAVLRASAGWRHAFGDVEPGTRLAFDGSQPFSVTGAPIARNAAFTELGVDLAISQSAVIGITYSGQYGGGNRENAGTIGVTWRY